MSAWLAEAHFSGSNYSVAGRPSAGRQYFLVSKAIDFETISSTTAGVVLVLSPIIVS
jgi:hypothetical protein